MAIRQERDKIIFGLLNQFIAGCCVLFNGNSTDGGGFSVMAALCLIISGAVRLYTVWPIRLYICTHGC